MAQDARKDARKLVEPWRVAELSASDVNIEEREVMVLDNEYRGDEITETIEMLLKASICAKNPELLGCDRAPSVIRLAVGRDFVTVRFGESSERMTYRRDGKIVIRTGSVVLLADSRDSRFVLFRYRPDGFLEAQTKSTKITWHETEEVLDARRLRDMVRSSISALLDVARDVIQA